MLESTRRSIVDTLGPANAAYQAALDAQRRYQAIAAPVLALQSDLSDIYDWHSRINDVVRSVSLPRTLLDQLAATAALFLPANLSGLDAKELYTILDLGQDDGLSLAWAPRTEIVKALLPLATREERYALLTERHDDVLDDVDASLQIVTHPELTGMVTILSAASRTARAGFSEGAQALAGNVLETAMKRHGNAWIRRSFPQVTYPKAGHHGTIGSVLDDTDDWGDLTLLQFKHYLVLAGMRNAFGPGATQDTFNRHLGAHQASPDHLPSSVRSAGGPPRPRLAACAEPGPRSPRRRGRRGVAAPRRHRRGSSRARPPGGHTHARRRAAPPYSPPAPAAALFVTARRCQWWVRRWRG